MRMKKEVWRCTAATGVQGGGGQRHCSSLVAGKGPGGTWAAQWQEEQGNLRASQLARIWGWLENCYKQLEPEAALSQAPEWVVPG